jgi:hypothetical protein
VVAASSSFRRGKPDERGEQQTGRRPVLPLISLLRLLRLHLRLLRLW